MRLTACEQFCSVSHLARGLPRSAVVAPLPRCPIMSTQNARERPARSAFRNSHYRPAKSGHLVNQCCRGHLVMGDRMYVHPSHPMNDGPSPYPRAGVVFPSAAALPLPDQIDRILGRCLVDVPALGAFEDPRIRTIATGFDAGQHHAALARRAERPQHRNQRWFEARISFGHVMLLRIGGCICAPPIAPDSAATVEQAWRIPRPATVQYCSHSPKIARRRLGFQTEQYCSVKHREMDQYPGSGSGLSTRSRK